ncbi:MAG: ATP-dependent DNA helicase [Gammaproteobacteria bacterium]|nr:ATP-dependent DNA helicase [Gammaproteobacteria bacterium]MDH3767817.1 ATP-dependent DNA helicase [Gammaproteobacteria bacterium]
MTDYAQFFGADSPLAEYVAGFAPRSQQQQMADAVGEALDGSQILVVEAGTGIGKTFAYLVPALLSGRRVIISTGTRNLQDQLFKRDLPTITQAIGRPVRVALLKGRSNYLCRHRLSLAAEEGRGSEWLRAIRHWASYTSAGDKAELREIPEDAPIWPAVTSTIDNCLGSECPQYDECHVVQARRAAQDADIVIVNHHLLLADFALKEEGFGELLPGADACIIDEAHQIPEVAANFFGVSVSARQVSNLVRDTVAELVNAGQSEAEWRKPGDELDRTLSELTLALAGTSGRQNWDDSVGDKSRQALDAVRESLTAFDEALGPLAGHSSGLDSCGERAGAIIARLDQICGDTEASIEGLRWVDVQRRGFSLNLTPFDVAERLAELISRHAGSWVFTSATLAVGEDFSHFLSRTGINDALTLRLDSPFDFERNTLLFLPNKLPLPAAPDYTRCVCEAVRPLIEAAGGGVFLLFTSYRALHEAAELFAENGELSLPNPLFVQGEAPREALLNQFREHGHAVLLGTASFWEGVDVRGEALRLVIIDKLPFASPGDPVMQARLEAIRRAGGNPFNEYQLPQAVLSLKQGVGRLIRDHDDFGIAVLCDPRIRTRNYGRVFLRSLPPMPITDSIHDACDFFDNRQAFELTAPA